MKTIEKRFNALDEMSKAIMEILSDGREYGFNELFEKLGKRYGFFAKKTFQKRLERLKELGFIEWFVHPYHKRKVIIRTSTLTKNFLENLGKFKTSAMFCLYIFCERVSKVTEKRKDGVYTDLETVIDAYENVLDMLFKLHSSFILSNFKEIAIPKEEYVFWSIEQITRVFCVTVGLLNKIMEPLIEDPVVKRELEKLWKEKLVEKFREIEKEGGEIKVVNFDEKSMKEIEKSWEELNRRFHALAGI